MATGAKATIGRALFSGAKSAMAASGSKASPSRRQRYFDNLFSKKNKQMEPSAQLKSKEFTARSTSALAHPDALRKEVRSAPALADTTSAPTVLERMLQWVCTLPRRLRGWWRALIRKSSSIAEALFLALFQRRRPAEHTAQDSTSTQQYSADTARHDAAVSEPVSDDLAALIACTLDHIGESASVTQADTSDLPTAPEVCTALARRHPVYDLTTTGYKTAILRGLLGTAAIQITTNGPVCVLVTEQGCILAAAPISLTARVSCATEARGDALRPIFMTQGVARASLPYYTTPVLGVTEKVVISTRKVDSFHLALTARATPPTLTHRPQINAIAATATRFIPYVCTSKAVCRAASSIPRGLMPQAHTTSPAVQISKTADVSGAMPAAVTVVTQTDTSTSTPTHTTHTAARKDEPCVGIVSDADALHAIAQGWCTVQSPDTPQSPDTQDSAVKERVLGGVDTTLKWCLEKGKPVIAPHMLAGRVAIKPVRQTGPKEGNVWKVNLEVGQTVLCRVTDKNKRGNAGVFLACSRDTENVPKGLAHKDRLIDRPADWPKDKSFNTECERVMDELMWFVEKKPMEGELVLAKVVGFSTKGEPKFSTRSSDTGFYQLLAPAAGNAFKSAKQAKKTATHTTPPPPPKQQQQRPKKGQSKPGTTNASAAPAQPKKGQQGKKAQTHKPAAPASQAPAPKAKAHASNTSTTPPPPTPKAAKRSHTHHTCPDACGHCQSP